jgi:iron complex outermembrane receptor protein
MYVLINSVSGQGNYTLSGKVTDEHNDPVTGATVYLQPVGKGTISGIRGEYSITGLSEGIYSIRVSFIGYKSFYDTVNVNSYTTFNVKLAFAPLSLQEVIITDDYAEIRKNAQPLNIETVSDDYLKQYSAGSLTQTLERLPGMSSVRVGSGQAKPLIRGLGFNQVVVVENGIKHEGQQWGADHGLEIDQYAVDRLEIVKGPSSLMYGSEAIGGVIEIKPKPLIRENSLNGSIDLVGKSNNHLLGTSVSLSARKKSLFIDLRATLIDYADFRVPADTIDIYSYRVGLDRNHLRNTAGNERNIHFSFGIIDSNFQSRFYVSSVNMKNGFFANAHGLEPRRINYGLHDSSTRDILHPYHKVNHVKISNHTQWRIHSLKFDLDLGFQRNLRQELSEYVNHGYMPSEFPDSIGMDPFQERFFDKYIYTANMKVSYGLYRNLNFIAGINTNLQDNRIDGRGFIIPAYEQFASGTYGIARYSFSNNSRIQLGLRYDHSSISTESYYDWFPSPVQDDEDNSLGYLQRSRDLDLSFSNVSWSLGYNFNQENLSLKANLGKSFRNPIAKELSANGVNYHRFSYEIGNPDLNPEISYQLDAGVETSLKSFALGITPFVNYFSNYIYLNPGMEHDRLYGNGNQVFRYTEARVFRYGGEVHFHYQPIKSIRLGAIGEYVYSEQLSGEKKGFTLPFSPPPSALLNVKYQKSEMKFLKNMYFSVDYVITAAQNNIVPPEEKTPGYQLVNLNYGGELNLKKQKLKISMQIRNLFNTKYFNHTSYYRLINVPEPGRNFILNISIPFSTRLMRQ